MPVLNLIEPPALDGDVSAARGYTLGPRQRAERNCIANLIARLDAAGFKVCGGNDGGERFKFTTMKEAMEMIFSVDEAWLYVRKAGAKKAHTLFIVLGNSGAECVNDYSIDDEDGFTAAMEAFDFEVFA